MSKVNTSLHSTVLSFKAKDVRRLLAHAKGCTEYLPMCQNDSDARGPGIVLVAEFSIYLASNGNDNSQEVTDDRFVFAEGLNPAAWSDEFNFTKTKVSLVGHNDGAVFMRLRDVELIMGKCEDHQMLRINIVHDGVRMIKVLMLPMIKIESRNSAETAF